MPKSSIDQWRHQDRQGVATAITANVMRAGARGHYFNTVDLVNRLEEENRLGKAGMLAAQLSRLDLVVLDELAICRSPAREVPADNFSVQGDVLVSAMGEGQVERAAKGQTE